MKLVNKVRGPPMIVGDGGMISFLYGSEARRWHGFKHQNFSRVLIAMDSGKLERFDYFEGYKARRSSDRLEDPAKFERYRRVKQFRQMLFDDHRVYTLAYPGLEADDLIALIAWKHQNVEVIGQDKDLLQLKPTYITKLRQLDGTEVLDRHVWKKMPVAFEPLIPREPKWVAFYLALMGDSSDGIPRLVPPHGLPQAAAEMSRYSCLWEYGLSTYGADFVRNVRLALLPWPGLVESLDDDELLHLLQIEAWRPSALWSRIRPEVLHLIEDAIDVYTHRERVYSEVSGAILHRVLDNNDDSAEDLVHPRPVREVTTHE